MKEAALPVPAYNPAGVDYFLNVRSWRWYPSRWFDMDQLPMYYYKIVISQSQTITNRNWYSLINC
jgi:hypothetical protein